MELDIFVVDAFTDQRFKGNSAAVIPLTDWLDAELMQDIAAENNLSETAFIKSLSANKYEIRWFSPLTEIDFCGHATLASSYVIFNHFDCDGEMSFPNQCPEPVIDIPQALLNGLSSKPVQVLKNSQAYFAVMASEGEVRNLQYQSEQLKQLAPFDVVVTAKAREYDFISRYFWPANGGDEDPVTGSIHAGLAPYWAQVLSTTNLVAYQASKRGGVLFCKLDEDRVLVSGFAVLYMQGKAHIES
jgi:predicted PhzF superfamily epimerase YddE/YHI9